MPVPNPSRVMLKEIREERAPCLCTDKIMHPDEKCFDFDPFSPSAEITTLPPNSFYTRNPEEAAGEMDWRPDRCRTALPRSPAGIWTSLAAAGLTPPDKTI